MSIFVTANFAKGRMCVTPSVFQYNAGMKLRFLGAALPGTYRVDFSNTLHGKSKPMIGNADGVEIPYEYFVPGQSIYAWIVVSFGEGGTITEYKATIPVSPRAKPTNETPTPAQQSAIDQAIAALNEGVEHVDEAVGQVGDTVDAALRTAKESGEFDGEDGFSPAVTITDIEQGHKVTITDASGEQSFDVMNGQPGENGKDGTDGTTFTPHVADNGDLSWTNDGGKPNPQTVNIRGQQGERGQKGDTGAQGPQGERGETGPQGEQGPKGEMGAAGPQGAAGKDGAVFTPTVSAEGVISWSNDGGLPNPQSVNIKGPKGEQGETGPQGVQGATGADGYSPTAAVSKSGNTATITITDKNGTTTAQVSDGAEGPQGPAGQNGTNGTDGVSPTISVTDITGGHRVTITDADGAHSFDVMDGIGSVQDVQVNGASVLQDGVANVPMADANNFGVVKVANQGVALNSNNVLQIVPASLNIIKSGSGNYNPISPQHQHESTFYGLAKASGDTTQSASSNTVGTYTDAAKSAIQTMLGISGIIAPVEGATASKPYAIGDAFLHGGALYKATDAIAANDAIAPGTNCEQTTIVDLLKGA